MTKVTNKRYPQGTEQTSKLLGLNFVHAQDKEVPHALDKKSVANLPVSEVEQKPAKVIPTPLSEHHVTDEHPNGTHSVEESGVKTTFSPMKIFTTVFPYLVVFTVGLLVYYFFFTKVNLFSIFTPKKPVVVVQTKKDTLAEEYKKQNIDAYNAWISGYFFEVSDKKIIDPDTDNSGNGLTNFQKFLLGLNPKAYDSLGLGSADSETLAQGISPQTGNVLTAEQKSILEKYIDMEVVMNRFALASSKNGKNVAGANIQTGQNGAMSITPRTSMEGKQTALPRPIVENPVNNPKPNLVKPNLTSPVTGPEAEPVLDNPYGLDLDTNSPARLEIPDLNINVPIIWTKSPNDFTRDLQQGVVHYPGTALPGQVGTTYISGHSSNYVWAKGDYNQVFSKLGDLPDNTSFKITVLQKNGRNAVLHYVVTHRKEYSPKDIEQFQNTDKSLVALSTCWPVGTTQRRLVVFGELTQVEK